MQFLDSSRVLRVSVDFKLKTSLLLRSGLGDEVSDNTVEMTPDEKSLYVKGEVWASLLRRALLRITGSDVTAKMIGKYDGKEGISPFWFEDAIVLLPGRDIRSGNRISREWGTVETGAIYSEEIAPAGMVLPMNLRYFWRHGLPDISDIFDQIQAALWVVDQGIENIGGGWSYGFGRLNFSSGQCREYNLKDRNERSLLWEKGLTQGKPLSPLDSPPPISKPWKKIMVRARVADGQLMGIHTAVPSLKHVMANRKLPDSFVYTRYVADGSGGVGDEVVITGKAVRQALLSTSIERRLRTEGVKVCLDMGKGDCKCDRCQWFGSTERGGIISVPDAPVKGCDTVVLNRIALCEHSMQNDHLFSGEYLAGGEFDVEVLLDCARPDRDWEKLEEMVCAVFDEMRVDNDDAPPGWNRLGGTATCTGQVAVKEIERINYGGHHVE
jgi:hypothetical protein